MGWIGQLTVAAASPAPTASYRETERGLAEVYTLSLPHEEAPGSLTVCSCQISEGARKMPGLGGEYSRLGVRGTQPRLVLWGCFGWSLTQLMVPFASAFEYVWNCP